MSNKLWGGRFKKKTDPQFEKFSSSLKWDTRLLPYDLKIDAVHVRALKACGVLTAAESKKLLRAISLLEKRHRNGLLRFSGNFEDIHSAVHAELQKMTGSLADKLHTGRSRNDLVSQSSRLYCKEHAERIYSLIIDLQKTIVSKAESCQKIWVPGMTHMQNAQVVSQAHIFLAYVEMLERAKMRLSVAKTLADVCVLGSGALAGANFKLNRNRMAKELGLAAVANNSYDVSGDRDFIVNLLSSAALLGTLLSRIAEDWMVAQTKGFSLVDIDQAFCAGSSMMPQKKNADFLELMRGTAGIFIGNLTGMLAVLKGLPTSYNRDLQWDKRYLFETVETCEEILVIFAKVFRTLRIHETRARELVKDENLYATDLADYLVKKGVPFKTAHHQVGQIVSFAEAKGLPISKIGIDLLRKLAPKLKGDVYGLFDAGHSVRMKQTGGSTHPFEVKKQIRQWKKRLK